MADPGRRAVLTPAGCWRGVREILPLCAFVLVLGATFGATATRAGLPTGLATLMSAAVFAGGAQFAALGLLGPPPALVPILLGTLVINARMLIFGAALAPWLSGLPLWQRLGGVAVLSDANWAQATRAHAAGERDAGVLVGAGATMWLVWVLGTMAGAEAAQAVPDLKRLGLDALLVAFFASALVEGWRGRADLPAAGGAVVTTLVCAELAGGEWSVLAGAAGGALAGLWADAHAR